MKTAISAALCAASLILAASAASASTVTLVTTNDGTVQDTNGPLLVIDNAQTATVTRINGTPPAFVQSVAVFEFNLSSILDTSTITSALFGFTTSGPVTATVDGFADFILEAYLGNNIIDEADFTTPGAPVLSAALPSSTTTGFTALFSLSNLGVLQSALVGDLLTLRLSVTGGNEQIRLAFLENPTYEAAFLTLGATPFTPPPPPNPSVIPLPAGLPLLLAGLGALGLVRRRRRTDA